MRTLHSINVIVFTLASACKNNEKRRQKHRQQNNDQYMGGVCRVSCVCDVRDCYSLCLILLWILNKLNKRMGVWSSYMKRTTITINYCVFCSVATSQANNKELSNLHTNAEWQQIAHNILLWRFRLRIFFAAGSTRDSAIIRLDGKLISNTHRHTNIYRLEFDWNYSCTRLITRISFYIPQHTSEWVSERTEWMNNWLELNWLWCGDGCGDDWWRWRSSCVHAAE